MFNLEQLACTPVWISANSKINQYSRTINTKVEEEKIRKRNIIIIWSKTLRVSS